MDRNIPMTIGVVVMLFSMSACTLERRTPLDVTPYTQRLSLTEVEGIHVIFEDTLPNRSLNETVWDNAIGPFWDVEESKQIGFTQNYSKFIPVAISTGIAGGAVGGAIVGLAVGPELVDTRIVIPFGRIFSQTFESAIAANSTNHSVCYFPNCDIPKDSLTVLKIRIDQFYVWEGPLNHLNLIVKGRAEYSNGGSIIKEYGFEKAMLSQKLGTVMSTHASFMKEMTNISNKLAQDVSTDIMGNIFK
jgi:hypothetical protein